MYKSVSNKYPPPPPPPKNKLKHLAHKMRELLLKHMQAFPSSIIKTLPLPLHQNLGYRLASQLMSSDLQHSNKFWTEDAI